MNIKGCIEWLEALRGLEIGHISILGENVDCTIKHLQMWEAFKERCGSTWGYGEGKYIRELMDNFEQKCFPKDEIPTGVK